MLSSRLSLLVPVLAVLFTYGCSFDASPLTDRQCTTNRDCVDGFMCFEGYCVVDPNAGDVDVPDTVDVEEEEATGCVDSDNDGHVGGLFCDESEKDDCDDENPQMYEGNTEVCDGLDNDCNGIVDDITPQACPLSQGVCEGVMTSCPAISADQVGTAVDAVCNYGDSYVEAEEYCSEGEDLLGLCSDGLTNHATLAEAAAVLCDGLDNDCDGETDEDNVITCYSGDRGELSVASTSCATGTRSCDDMLVACQGEVLPTADENSDATRCDGNDNDCNGSVDPECTCTNGQERPCYTGPPGTENVGTCHGSTQQCVNGVWEQTCDGEVVPVTESCGNMGFDNNCDGDDDNIGGETYNDPCFTGLDGVCNPGVKACNTTDSSGTFGCQQTVFPANETCSDIGTDNDCDGDSNDLVFPDGGNHRVNDPCTASAQGVCAQGTWICPAEIGAAPVCQQGEQQPEVECDGIDQDCDGSDSHVNHTITQCATCTDVCGGSNPICCPVDGGGHECRDAVTCN